MWEEGNQLEVGVTIIVRANKPYPQAASRMAVLYSLRAAAEVKCGSYRGKNLMIQYHLLENNRPLQRKLLEKGQ